MHALLARLYNDEAGFIVSAELVLVSTITVLGMIVGLSELAWNVNEELEDVGSAFAAVNQSYLVRAAHGHKACAASYSFHDCPDFGAGPNDLSCGY